MQLSEIEIPNLQEAPDALTKRCPRCETTQPLDNFPLDRKGTLGRYGYCRPCKANYMRESRIVGGPSYPTVFRSNLTKALRVAGATRAWYEERVARHGGRCAICGRPPSRHHARLTVDHNHRTGQPRGLLCGDCNKALGLCQDSPQRLRRAARYLEAEGDL